MRNMSSVGIDLKRWVDAGLLQFQCFRPGLLGLEAHLFAMQKFVGEFGPSVVVIDPISDLVGLGTGADVSAMLIRQVDYLKSKGVTALFTSMNSAAELSQAEQQLTSLVGHVAARQGDGGQRGAQPGAVRAQVPRDGTLQPDPRVPPHQPGDRVGRRLRRAAGRAHRLGPPGAGGQGRLRWGGAPGGSRAAPGQPGTATRIGRGTDGDVVARVRGRSRHRATPVEPWFDQRRGSSRPARRAGPTPPGRHRQAPKTSADARDDSRIGTS